jgi:hypothetical protein
MELQSKGLKSCGTLSTVNGTFQTLTTRVSEACTNNHPTETAGHAQEPDHQPQLIEDLILFAVAAFDVDDGEEAAREHEHEHATRVHRGVTDGQLHVALDQRCRLRDDPGVVLAVGAHL